jgi:hypothetical protein
LATNDLEGRELLTDCTTTNEAVINNIAEAAAFDWRCIQTLIGQKRSRHPTPEKVEVSLKKRETPPPNNCYYKISDENELSEFIKNIQL